MTTFTGFLNKVREGRDGFWSFHANDYIRKITLEYLKAPSRGQRFNYRRRLKEVAEKHTTLQAESRKLLIQTWFFTLFCYSVELHVYINFAIICKSQVNRQVGIQKQILSLVFRNLIPKS